MFSIDISPRYVFDMNASTTYINDVLCNKDAAENLKNKADSTIDEIAKNPYMFSEYVGRIKLKYNYRKAKVNNYYIFFRIDEEMQRIKIARFLFGRMNLKNINQII